MRWWRPKKIIRSDTFKDSSQAVPVSRERLWIFVAIISAVGIILFVQAFRLSVSRGQEFSERYEEIHSQREWILPPRGLISDVDGIPLALNAPGKKETEFSRLYPEGVAFSNLLGFIGRISPEQLARDESYLPFDLVGKEGIEASYENYLRGMYGTIEKSVKTQGSDDEQRLLVNQPIAGNNLSLTVDASMQKKLFDVLDEQVKKFNTPGAAGIVMDPRTGALRSLVSLPAYDNNAITSEVLNDSARSLFNRAISGTYPPGSTVKPFMAAAALSEHIIKPETIIHDTGKIEVRSIYDPSVVWRFHGWKALGSVDMRKAIALSSNVYFFTVGGGYGGIKGLGPERIKSSMNLFGFGEKTGIDLGGEQQGFYPIPQWKQLTFREQWFIGDTFNTSIGQGFVRVTPLQLASATVALANRGTLFKPYLVSHITDQEGRVIFSQKPEVIRSPVLDSNYLQVAREGMRQAVSDGTIWRLRDFPIPVAGKTGTSQAGQGKSNHGWVTIFFPYEKPEIVLTILIENGEGGEQSAVPAAKNFLEWYIQNKMKPNS